MANFDTTTANSPFSDPRLQSHNPDYAQEKRNQFDRAFVPQPPIEGLGVEQLLASAIKRQDHKTVRMLIDLISGALSVNEAMQK